MYLSKAPLRIGLAGGGTDISPYTHDFGGAVLNATIDKYVYAKLIPIEGRESTFAIRKGDKTENFTTQLNTNSFPPEFELICETCRYILSEQSKLNRAVSLEIAIDADLGGGLGSSSAMVVAIIAALYRWLNLDSTSYDIAKMAFHIEREILNYAGGKQDQYSASFGGFNFMKFMGEDVEVESLAIGDDIKQKLVSNLVLYNTRKFRISGEIIKDQQINLQNKKDQHVEFLHFLKTQAYSLLELLQCGDLNQFGDFLHQGWLHKKSTSDKISTEELDIIYNAALDAGATGGKVLGAGGGGYMLFYCPTSMIKKAVNEKLLEFGGNIVPFSFTAEGVGVVKCDG